MARKRGTKGNAFIEFTILIPILLLVSTGMVSVGFILHNSMLLNNAVSMGAQAVAFSRGQTSDPCATGYRAISNAAPGLTPSLSLTYVINGTSYSGVTCTAAASNLVQGSTVQITGTYPAVFAVFSEDLGSHSLAAQVSEYVQ